MPTSLLSLLTDLLTRKTPKAFDLDDPRLAVAVLMFHVIAVDGAVKPEERARFIGELASRYDLDAADADALAEAARAVERETVDLGAFTSGLQRRLAPEELRGVVRSLWDMVLIDGELHEFEDNIVWRIGDLLGLEPAERIALRKEVEAEHAEAAARARLETER